MTPEARVNARVNGIIQRGERGQPTETDNVELKSGWEAVKDHYKVARQIAGCVNASMGNDFILLIGVQEKPDFEVTGASDIELSDWWTNVKNCFAGASPSFATYVLPYGEKSVVALVFNTTLAPFLVRNQWHGKRDQKGDVAAEVPWREANGARTATREDLLSMLVSAELTPDCELRDCLLGQGSNGGRPYVVLTMTLYVEPKTDRRLVIPIHRCEALIRIGEQFTSELTCERLFAGRNEALRHIEKRPDSVTIVESATELLINGPGAVILQARMPESISRYNGSDIDVIVKIGMSRIGHPIAMRCTLRPAPAPNDNPESPTWRLGRQASAPL